MSDQSGIEQIVDAYQILVRKLTPEEGAGYFAEAIDMPGCGVDGVTPEQAITECRKALAAAIMSYARKGKELPRTGEYSELSHSGNFMIRIPRSLHRRLVLKATAEGVSLNQYCMYLMAEGVAANRDFESPVRTAYSELLARPGTATAEYRVLPESRGSKAPLSLTESIRDSREENST